ncbi:MAG: CoA-binding protein, partial [Promethearchaeota archaeon]
MTSSHKNDISFFFDPKSIAIIGASATQGKVGNTVLLNIIKSEYKGKIYPINPRESEILGIKAYKSVLDVKEKIDIAIFVVPSRFVLGAAIECGEKGVR